MKNYNISQIMTMLSDDVQKAQAVYTPWVLRIYDGWVLGLPNRWIWKCPTQKILELYNLLLKQSALRDMHWIAARTLPGLSKGLFRTR